MPYRGSFCPTDVNSTTVNVIKISWFLGKDQSVKRTRCYSVVEAVARSIILAVFVLLDGR
jgi:hypothetical protein